MGETPRLRAQKVTEILDSSFRLYRENFIVFLGILAVAYVPAIILLMAAQGILLEGVMAAAQAVNQAATDEATRAARERAMQMQIFFAIGMFGVAALLWMIIAPLATGALTRAVGARYLNEETSIGKAYGHIFRMVFRYFGTILLSGLVIMLGFILCIAPGIIFSIWFAFTSSVCVLENLGGTAAMGRSRALARGHAGRIIGLWILIVLVNLALNYGIGAACGFLLPLAVESQVTVFLINQGIQQVLGMLIMPFFSVAWILLYYDIRIRKEAFDLEVLARDMGRAGPGAPPAPAP